MDDLEQAKKHIRMRLAQLVEPRAGYVYTPTPSAPQKSTASRRPYKRAGDLADLYRSQGLDRYKAWDQYIIDTILQPRFSTDPVDAKVFYKFFDRLAG